MAQGPRNGQMNGMISSIQSPGMKRTVVEMLNKAKNVRPYWLYDYVLHPAAGPAASVRFFGTPQGQPGSAFVPGQNKDIADTVLLQQGKLNGGDTFIAMGMSQFFPARWLAYGATQANRTDDYENNIKDIQQLARMGASVELTYGNNVTVFQLTQAMLPRTTNDSYGFYLNGRIDDYLPFGGPAMFTLDDQTSVAVNHRVMAPAAFGSGQGLLHGIVLHGIIFTPPGLDSDAPVQKMNAAASSMGFGR